MRPLTLMAVAATLVQLVLQPALAAASELHADTKLKIFSGLYTERLPDPVFYDQFVPVVLHYKTPKFNKTEVTFNNWYNCTSERYPYSLSCPVVFHLNAAVSNLHIDFETLQPGKSDQQVPQRDHFDKLTQNSDFCHKINPHFPGLYTNGSDISDYESSLTKCHRSSYVETNITDYVYNMRYPFSRMETNFYESFYRPVSQLSANLTGQRLLASAVLSNSRTAVQGSILGAFYAERNRWSFAASHCLTRTLPPSIVTEEKLKSLLNSIQNGLEGQRLVFGNSSISKYFSLPLTDCTHTESELIVRLLVPVTSKNPLQLHRIRPILFNFDDVTACGIKNLGTYYVYNPENQLAYQTTCQPGELCLLETHGRAVDLCVSSVLAENLEGIRQNCEFECSVPAAPFSVTRVHREKIVFFEQRPLKAVIVCTIREDTVKFGLELKHRTYELELGRNCALEITDPTKNSTQSFRSPSAQCSEDRKVNISLLLPWNYVKDVQMDGSVIKILEHFDLDRILSVKSNEIPGASKRVLVKEGSSSFSLGLIVLVALCLILAAGQLYLFLQFRKIQEVTKGSKDRVLYRNGEPVLVENEETF